MSKKDKLVYIGLRIGIPWIWPSVTIPFFRYQGNVSGKEVNETKIKFEAKDRWHNNLCHGIEKLVDLYILCIALDSNYNE